MNQRDIQNLILLGVGGFAVYYLFIRKAPLAVPFPTNVTVTPQIIGAGVSNPNQQAVLTGQSWQPGPGGFPTMSPQGFPTSFEDVLVE